MKEWLVAADGSTAFPNVQAAVDAAAPGDRIRIQRGIYSGRVVINKPGLTLVGEDAAHTVLTHSACARDTYPDGREKGTFLSFTLLTAAPDVTLEHLTIRNDAGDGRDVGQAVALYAAGDRGVFRHCRLIAHQDTLFTGPVMDKVLAKIAPMQPGQVSCVPSVGDSPDTGDRLYFEHCLIQGDVDFIFGPYRSWFEQCTLHMNARGGWYTAPNTPEHQPWGMVFHRCRLTGDCEDRMAYLGRPWRRWAAAAFLQCQMDACVSPLGFADWDEIRVVTRRLCEGGTTGARQDITLRHPRQGILPADAMNQITMDAVLNGWHPNDRRQ